MPEGGFTPEVTTLATENKQIVSPESRHPNLKQNEELFRRFEIIIPAELPVNYEDRYYADLSPELLNKSLILWSTLAAPLGLKSEEPISLIKKTFFSQVSNEDILGQLSANEIAGALQPLKERMLTEFPPDKKLPLTFGDFIKECKTVKQLKQRIEACMREDFRVVLNDGEFMSTTHYGWNSFFPNKFCRSNDNVFKCLDDPDGLIGLYKYRNDFMKKKAFLENISVNQLIKRRSLGNELIKAKVGVSLSYEKAEELAKLPDETISKIGSVLITFDQGSLDDATFPKALLFSQMDSSALRTLYVDLQARNFPSFFDAKWDNGALAVLTSKEKGKGLDIFKIGDLLASEIGFKYRDNVEASAHIMFLNFVSEHPEVIGQIKRFVYDIPSSEVESLKELILDKDYIRKEEERLRNRTKMVEELIFWLKDDSDFNLTDYIDTNGDPTAKFVNRLAKIGYTDYAANILNPHVLEKFDEGERNFWEYYLNLGDERIKFFFAKHKDQFSELVVDGKQTPYFCETLAKDDSEYFAYNGTKEQWKMVFGEEAVNKFLNALPKLSDEKRNAFTHNEYDRTSEFIQYLLESAKDNFGLNAEDFDVLTGYVEKFEFSRTPLLFHYFKNLYLLETGKITELPKDVKQSGITSTEELERQLAGLKEIIFSEKPLLDLSNFSTFELQMLKMLTGKSSHRFDGGKADFEQIIEDFQRDYKDGQIQSLPEEYKPETIEMANVKIQFDAEKIRSDYEILSREILESMENPQDVDGLKGDLGEILRGKIDEIQKTSLSSEGGKKRFLETEIQRFSEYFEKVGGIDSLDTLMLGILDMKFDKTELRDVDSIVRRIAFRKIFVRNFSPEFIQNLKSTLGGEITPQAILGIINVVDHQAKAHVLNFRNDKNEGYWEDKTFEQIKGRRPKESRIKNLPEIFAPYAENLRQAVEEFQAVTEAGTTVINTIPDRGFIGEMSGYLADVCYTAEYPLLKKWPNVVPYKFVVRESGTDQLRFLGSLLVFEVEDKDGNPSMLIRAFDVPQETEINMQEFIETFLDRMAVVAKQRNKKRILIPGNQGAISNYQMTINHISEKYISGKQKVSLKEHFAFNNYDLTENCYMAREITGNSSNFLIQ